MLLRVLAEFPKGGEGKLEIVGKAGPPAGCCGGCTGGGNVAAAEEGENAFVDAAPAAAVSKPDNNEVSMKS